MQFKTIKPGSSLIASIPVNKNTIELRTLDISNLDSLTTHPYSVRIDEPHDTLPRLEELFATHGLWTPEAGAAAIIETKTDRFLGTIQYYRSAPCIHGFEIGYVIHNPADRGKGYANQALKQLSDYLFTTNNKIFRHQLLIEVWNTPSWKVAERAGFVREGILRAAGFGEGEPADCFVYSRLYREFTQSQASLNG